MNQEESSNQRPEDHTIAFKVADLNLPEGGVDALNSAEELTPGDAMLHVSRGPNVGASYLLDTDVARVGRHPDNEVFLDDVTVSRRHAEFVRENGSFSIVDVGSLNGTYLNGNRVDKESLKRGDEIQIGKFKFVFLTGSAEQ